MLDTVFNTQDLMSKRWINECVRFMLDSIHSDAAHDHHHIYRVTKNALDIYKEIKRTSDIEIDLDIVYAACILHDIDQTPKDSELRSVSSVLAAQKAVKFLNNTSDFPKEKIPRVFRAIVKHSYSGSIEGVWDPYTIEDSIVQDADRLDALGHIGLARMFYVSGSLHVPHLYGKEITHVYTPNDKIYVLDHMESKISKLPALMKTEPGRRWAKERYTKMIKFIEELEL